MKVAPALTLALLVLALTAWGSSTRGSAEASAGWHRTDVKPVTQPAAIGDRILLYVVDRARLRVMALDARTGATVWSDAAFPSSITQGVPPFLTVVPPNVIYVHRVGLLDAQLVAAEARTGRAVWRSATFDFTSWPHVCTDDAKVICVTASLAPGLKGSYVVRFAASTGRLISKTRIARGPLGRELGDGLYDPAQRNPELLLAMRGSAVAWKKPLAKVFTRPGVSTDWGWDFDRIERIGLFVGTAGWKPVRTIGPRIVLDLSRTMSAGFRIRDGTVLWRDRGSQYVCGLLPCAGSAQPSFSSPADSSVGGTRIGVRLRPTGTVTARRDAVNPESVRNVHVSVEGFRLGNGRTLWTFDAGSNVGLVTFRRLPPQIGPTTIALTGTRGVTAVDLATGTRRPVAERASAWCSAQILYKVRMLGRSVLYGGQLALEACTASGTRVATPSRAPAFIGAIAGRTRSLIVWSSARGVFAAPVAR